MPGDVGGMMATAPRTGRPWRRTAQQVYVEETHCWLCGQHVDQTLPANHDLARSIDHVIPRSLGGTNERSNLRLAHRRCNSRRRAGAPRAHNPRSETWWDDD